jgi:hypothetical protein
MTAPAPDRDTREAWREAAATSPLTRCTIPWADLLALLDALERAEEVAEDFKAFADAAVARAEKAEAHILDIDAHATPFGDIPDEPGYVGTYLLTAGALHRALGTIGHTAPSCEAEAERDVLQARLDTLTDSIAAFADDWIGYDDSEIPWRLSRDLKALLDRAKGEQR